MPLYLVRWPTLVASIIKAESEADLQIILDETGDTVGCSWEVYRGPLALDFKVTLDVQIEHRAEGMPLSPGHIKVTGDTRAFLERPIEIVRPGGDTDGEMMDTVFERMFPDLHQAWWDQSLRWEDKKRLSHVAMRKAAAKELLRMVQASWQQEQRERRGDFYSVLASEMGTSPEVIEIMTRGAREAANPPKDPDERQDAEDLKLAVEILREWAKDYSIDLEALEVTIDDLVVPVLLALEAGRDREARARAAEPADDGKG